MTVSRVKNHSVGSGVDQHAYPLNGVRLDPSGGSDQKTALAVLGRDRVVLDLHEILVGDKAHKLAVIVNHRKFLNLAVL